MAEYGYYRDLNISKTLFSLLFQFDAEFRRFCVSRDPADGFEKFQSRVEKLHQLEDIPFVINYTDPVHGDLLPINNDINFSKAVTTAKPLLRLLLQRKGNLILD